MHLILPSICVGFFVILLAAAPAGAEAATPHVEAELLADVETVKAGEPFMVGVRLKMTPKWHVYWSNPGETGLPTVVRFTVPEGFKVGPLLYPLPKTFIQPGEITGYGYEGEVLLMAVVTPPAAHTGEVPIAARAEWLVCDDVCIPGKVALNLKIGSGEEARPANAELFSIWRKRLPLDQQPDGTPAPKVKHEAVTSAEGSTDNILRFSLDAAPGKVEWFPPDHPALTFTPPQVRQDGAVTEVRFSVAALKGMKDWPAQLEGLIVYTTKSGERQGVTVPVAAPVASDDAQASR